MPEPSAETIDHFIGKWEKSAACFGRKSQKRMEKVGAILETLKSPGKLK
jgi:hypothetical protein